jgi:hypothetical protein
MEKARRLVSRNISGIEFGKALQGSETDIMKGTLLIDTRNSCMYGTSHQSGGPSMHRHDQYRA